MSSALSEMKHSRQVAAAILGDASKVEYVPLTASARFEALAANEIDLLIRNTTWTASRDRDLGNDFTAPTFYDGCLLYTSPSPRD